MINCVEFALSIISQYGLLPLQALIYYHAFLYLYDRGTIVFAPDDSCLTTIRFAELETLFPLYP